MDYGSVFLVITFFHITFATAMKVRIYIIITLLLSTLLCGAQEKKVIKGFSGGMLAH